MIATFMMGSLIKIYIMGARRAEVICLVGVSATRHKNFFSAPFASLR